METDNVLGEPNVNILQNKHNRAHFNVTWPWQPLCARVNLQTDTNDPLTCILLYTANLLILSLVKYKL